jgi:hypothetical protein
VWHLVSRDYLGRQRKTASGRLQRLIPPLALVRVGVYFPKVPNLASWAEQTDRTPRCADIQGSTLGALLHVSIDIQIELSHAIQTEAIAGKTLATFCMRLAHCQARDLPDDLWIPMGNRDTFSGFTREVRIAAPTSGECQTAVVTSIIKQPGHPTDLQHRTGDLDDRPRHKKHRTGITNTGAAQ